ncbi:MAG: signal peptide peptidase SppA [candidate division WOR-3 bacterium]
MIWKKYWWLWTILGLVIIVSLSLGIARTITNEVIVVKIAGTIQSSKEITEWIEVSSKRPQVKGMLVIINSPGGGIVPSDEIFRSIQSFKKSGKPVVAYLGSVAASGGYYVACAADYIISHPMTITGSIGVIFEVPVIKNLMDKIGVEMVVIKSGPNKDIGSPFRKMTDEERKIVENIINQGYNNFLQVVCESRQISIDSLKKIADGRVLTGDDAKKFGLVDTLGDLFLAKSEIKKRIKAKGPVIFVEKRKLPYFLRLLNPEEEVTNLIQPRLEYRMVLL